MPKLPVYTRNSHINASPIVERRSSGLTESLGKFSSAASDLAVKWQETKNAAETLDGKNKMEADVQDILMEANDYNDYTSTKELEAKEAELLQKARQIPQNIVAGFGTDTNASDFIRRSEMDTVRTEAQIKNIFRRKYIDNNNANLIVSEDRNRENFISTGNAAFRNSYLADLENSFKAGFIDKAAYTQAKLKTEDWEKYMLYRQAESNPQAVIDNLKSGKYQIKPEDYNDVLKNLNSIKTNDELMRNYEEAVRQNTGESNAMDYIYSNASYADKLKYINDAEIRGDISGSFSQKARRAIKQFKPDGGKTMSQAQNIAEVLQRAYDLNEGNFDSTEYLNGIRDLRSSITEAVNNGDISYKDGVTLNNQLNQATRKRISQETNAVSYQFGKTIDFFKESLPPEFQNDAIRELFYQTQDIDDSLSDKEKQKIYREKAVSVVDKIKIDNRLAAEKALADMQTQLSSDFIPTIATKLGISEEDLNRKIDHTAKRHGMTREQVVQQLSKGL